MIGRGIIGVWTREPIQAYGCGHKQRAKRFGAEYQKISPKEIFDRDRWACKLCGTSTPAHLRGTRYDNAPQLDHIIPISLGGPHSRDNLQCACRECNMRKGNRMGEPHALTRR